MGEWYGWLKIFHIISFTSWMAGLFYLPRLFVYHADSAVGSDRDAVFKVMELRLLKAIMRPALIATLFTGSFLVYLLGVAFDSSWLIVKFSAVLGLILVQGLLERDSTLFAKGFRPHSSRYYRVLNEVPTVLFIIIVCFVILKP